MASEPKKRSEYNICFIINSEAAPGSPVEVIEITPASFPAKEVVSEELGAFSSRPFTLVIDPVTLTFFCVPAPTTTTSLSSWLSDSIFTLMTPRSIKELHEELKELVYGPSSFSSSYAMKLVKGGSIGDIYGKAFVRDAEGNIVYQTEGDHKGLPAVEGEGNTIKVGNANPRFIMGWNHTFSYKGFSLYFLLDWRYGGKILSQTQAEMDRSTFRSPTSTQLRK